MNFYTFLNAAGADAANPGGGNYLFLTQGWRLKIQMLRDFKSQADRCGITLAGVIDNRPDLQFRGLSLSGYTDAREYAASGNGIEVNRNALLDPLQFVGYCRLHRVLFGTNPHFYTGPEEWDHLYDRAKLATDMVRFILGAPCIVWIDGYFQRKLEAEANGIIQDYIGFESTLRSFLIEVRGEYDPLWCQTQRAVPVFMLWDHFADLAKWGATPPDDSVVLVATAAQAREVAAYTAARLHVTVAMAGMADADLRAIGEVVAGVDQGAGT